MWKFVWARTHRVNMALMGCDIKTREDEARHEEEEAVYVCVRVRM